MDENNIEIVKNLKLFIEEYNQRYFNNLKNPIERKNWLLNQNDYKIKINDLSSLLENMKKRENELLSDRESSVKALQQTIEATKELSSRYNDEKVKRPFKSHHAGLFTSLSGLSQNSTSLAMCFPNKVPK